MSVHPPGPKQKRYRGRIRRDMRSAYNHLKMLVAWDAKYRGGDINHYPNQLGTAGEVATLISGTTQLGNWLLAVGAIPSR